MSSNFVWFPIFGWRIRKNWPYGYMSSLQKTGKEVLGDNIQARITRLVPQVTKSSQVKVMTWLWLDLLTFFTFFSIFFSLFWFKKGPNCPKVCQKCKILNKWPFGTKIKRQNVFSRSPSKKFKVIFLTYFQFSKKVKDMTWLDFS